MKELITLNYDITDAVTSADMQKLAQSIKASNLSDCAMKADVPTQLEMSKLASDKCALVIFHPQMGNSGYLKKYANYDKDLTELNTFIFLQNAGHLPDEICKTAAYHSLEVQPPIGG